MAKSEVALRLSMRPNWGKRRSLSAHLFVCPEKLTTLKWYLWSFSGIAKNWVHYVCPGSEPVLEYIQYEYVHYHLYTSIEDPIWICANPCPTTLLGTNLSPPKGTFEDNVPFPKVGYDSSLKGIHQSVNRSIDQSIDQSINQSINQSIKWLE